MSNLNELFKPKETGDREFDSKGKVKPTKKEEEEKKPTK